MTKISNVQIINNKTFKCFYFTQFFFYTCVLNLCAKNEGAQSPTAGLHSTNSKQFPEFRKSCHGACNNHVEAYGLCVKGRVKSVGSSIRKAQLSHDECMCKEIYNLTAKDGV